MVAYGSCPGVLVDFTFALQGSVPKETKSEPQSKVTQNDFRSLWKSFEPLDPLLIFLIFLLIPFNLYGSLEFRKKQKISACGECSRIHPANLWLVLCSARIH